MTSHVSWIVSKMAHPIVLRQPLQTCYHALPVRLILAVKFEGEVVTISNKLQWRKVCWKRWWRELIYREPKKKQSMGMFLLWKEKKKDSMFKSNVYMQNKDITKFGSQRMNILVCSKYRTVGKCTVYCARVWFSVILPFGTVMGVNTVGKCTFYCASRLILSESTIWDSSRCNTVGKCTVCCARVSRLILSESTIWDSNRCNTVGKRIWYYA